MAATGEGDDAPPKRAMSRLLTEYQLGIGKALVRAFGTTIERGPIFTAVLRDRARRRRTGDGRCISISAISASLGRPFETVRRNVHALSEAGLLELGPSGVRVVEAAMDDDRVRIIDAALIEGVRWLLRSLANVGVQLDPGLQADAVSDDLCRMAGMDLYLCTFEFHSPQSADWEQLIVLGGVMVLCVRAITDDVALSKTYGAEEAIPPLSARRPVTIKELATELGLPYSTVWRRVRAAATSGTLTPFGGGYVVSVDWLSSPKVLENLRIVNGFLRRVLHELAADAARLDGPA